MHVHKTRNCQTNNKIVQSFVKSYVETSAETSNIFFSSASRSDLSWKVLLDHELDPPFFFFVETDTFTSLGTTSPRNPTCPLQGNCFKIGSIETCTTHQYSCPNSATCRMIIFSHAMITSRRQIGAIGNDMTFSRPLTIMKSLTWVVGFPECTDSRISSRYNEGVHGLFHAFMKIEYIVKDFAQADAAN